MTKETYNGLSTKRSAVECAPLLETSSKVKIKVKTNTKDFEWKEEADGLTPLSSDISNSSFD